MVIALDSNIFIAALSTQEQHSALAQQLLRDIASGNYHATASSIIYGEVLGVSNKTRVELDLQSFFASIDNLVTVPADDRLCLKAGELRRQHGGKLKLVDALHLATAINAKAEVFITNDITFAKAAKRLQSTVAIKTPTEFALQQL